MPEVSEIDKCRAKRKVAKASVTRNMNHVRELISSDGSVSKVRQFAKGVEEGRTKARDLTKELEELDPASIETDGSWLEEVEFDVNEVLGEVAEYLLKSESPSPNEQSSITPPTAQNNDENTETVNDSMSGKRTGLKGVEIPSFDGKPDKWPYFWGIFSSLVHKNDKLTPAIKLAHLNSCLTDRVREVIACLTGEPGDYDRAVKQLTDRYGDPREIIDAHLRRISSWPHIKDKDREEFQRFADALQAAVFALDKPDYRHKLASIPLCTLLVQKLPPRERDEWVKQVESEDYSEDMKGLAKWAQVRTKTMRKRERYNIEPPDKGKESTNFQPPGRMRGRVHALRTSGFDPEHQSLKNCPLCDKKHTEVSCPLFFDSSVEKRWEIVKNKRVCFGCLKPGHQRRLCTKSTKCGVDSCDKGHHYLLHSSKSKHEKPSDDPPKTPEENKAMHCGKAQISTPISERVALKTVSVPFIDDSGRVVNGLVLLDSGSETTLVRAGFTNQLGIKGPKQSLTVDAVGGVRTVVKSQRVHLPFAPHITKAKITGWTINNICAPVPDVNWPEIKHNYAHLNDVPIEPLSKGTVDVLLGLDAAALMAPVQVRRGGHLEPYAELTPLGWVIAGPVSASNGQEKRVLCVHVSGDEGDANRELRKFWDVDSFGVRAEIKSPYTPGEQKALDILDQSCKQQEFGYQLGLLWKTNRPSLPNNYDTALKRLESVERRLLKDPKLAEGYLKAINAYVEKGFARKLSEEERIKHGEQWFLPHHPVLSPHKPLPRVVFDSAAKHGDICLNDCLQAGPSLHNDLPGILMRFREKPVALTGDMFCHVRLKPEDCKYHRYLWRGLDMSRPPDVYEMNCLVFGDKSSPCEANYAVIRTPEDNKEEWPVAAAVVKRDIFVDDLYTSCYDDDEAITLRKDVTNLMAKGGFPMRKWLSSSRKVLETIPEEERAVPNKNVNSGELPSGRALGVKWDAKSDNLGFALAHIDRPKAQNTKRGILKRLAA
ncbi:Hypothetical predicted protein, partial [Paramuricea clavata]